MRRNGMCPICFIKQLFIKRKQVNLNPPYDDLDNGSIKKPPMGWSSWNTFKNIISENLILDTGKALKEKGLLDAGYVYLNIDDNWQSSERNEKGDLVADYEQFPHGIKWLVDELNKDNIKVGLYTSNGTLTCQSLPASLHKEKQDALMLARSGIEYFKYDFCNHEYLPIYAPLIYSISISKFDSNINEYLVSNAKLNGYARYMSDNKIPGGQYVSGLDKNLGSIEFKVNVKEKGDYSLSINIRRKGLYNKYLIALVNESKEYEIEFPPQGSTLKTARFQTIVSLNKGENTIKLYNPITSKHDSEFYQYRRMAHALMDATKKVAIENNTVEKPICYSICEWGFGKPYLWGRKAGNLWRTTFDITPSWWWIKLIYEHNVKLYKYASIGHYNDPDMLEVGNGKLTYNQNLSHFITWCMMSAPLILGNDIRIMTDQVKEIVTNKNLIAINQDELSMQCKRVKRGFVDVLVKPLSNNKYAIAFFNKTNSIKNIKFNLNSLYDDKYINLTKHDSFKLVNQVKDETIETNNIVSISLDKSETKVYVF